MGTSDWMTESLSQYYGFDDPVRKSPPQHVPPYLPPPLPLLEGPPQHVEKLKIIDRHLSNDETQAKKKAFSLDVLILIETHIQEVGMNRFLRSLGADFDGAGIPGFGHSGYFPLEVAQEWRRSSNGPPLVNFHQNLIKLQFRSQNWNRERVGNLQYRLQTAHSELEQLGLNEPYYGDDPDIEAAELVQPFSDQEIEQVRMGFLINEVSTPWIKSGRGLRQGDPLSLYLFTLIAEVLSSLLRRACQTDGMAILGRSQE
ncbi:hypothetical protein QJS10_CPA05g01728 [Acorus calamus]|uniref:Reverse transcriptase domain-containing protein n=1 Tax=Acorus calamus TaxID=4465 RepID=A0AAV9ET82_ACOCL|nr:hypothetical protein QJS10_CPA05g01728 [Acorus calamus]